MDQGNEPAKKLKQKKRKRYMLDQSWVRVPVELAMRWHAFWITLFGWRWAYFWARWVARVGWVVLGKQRGYALRNLELCFPEMPQAQRVRIGKLSFRHSVYQFLDYLLVPRYFKTGAESPHFHGPKDNSTFSNWYRAGQAAFNLSLHLGNFDIVSFNIGRETGHLPLLLIVKEVRPPVLNRWLTRARNILGSEVRHADEGARQYLRAVKEKRNVGTVVDQNGGDFAPVETFFGVPCTWQAEFTRMVLRGGGRVCFHACVRRGDRFEFDYLEPEYHQYAPDTDQMQIVRDYRDWVEKLVRQYPEQYLWVHRRFKGRRKGWPDRYENLGRSLTPEDRKRLLDVPPPKSKDRPSEPA